MLLDTNSYLRQPPGFPLSHDLLQFYLYADTTDYTGWLTSAAYSDCASFTTGANVRRVKTATTPDSNPVTTAIYLPAIDPVNDRLIFKDTNSQHLVLWDRDWNEISQITTAHGYAQSTTVDPINQCFYTFNSDNFVRKTDYSGNILATYSCTYNDGHVYYDYLNQIFYVARETGIHQVEVWAISGASVVQIDTLWYSGADGVCFDRIFNKLINFDGTGGGTGGSSATRFREQTLDGLSGIAIYPWAITTGMNTEGLCIGPDGSFYAADPSGFHASIVNGNRFWWMDPRNNTYKYDRSPHMIRFDRWPSGPGVVSGTPWEQIITAHTGDRIYTPIFDTQGSNNTNNASAWNWVWSSHGGNDKLFRGSNSAPTTSPVTPYDSPRPNYSGWGSTVPSAEQSVPGSFRYKQGIALVTDI